MINNVLILTDPTLSKDSSLLNRAFKSLGEYVEQLSHLFTILEERKVDLILIAEDFPALNFGVIRRLRSRSPESDIWKIVYHENETEDSDIYDGWINIYNEPKQIAKKIKQILHRKALLKKYEIIGRSDKLKIIAETIDRIAPTSVSVLIIGPSGSGKELVAKAIHNNSQRSDGSFVAVNCGALAEGILESELFGHEKGAFTGSVGKRDGLFVQANSGTIFLDEIGETKPDMQVKLLRVLEDGYFYPVGGDRPVRTDARVIAATNRDLTEAIRDGIFREDLYFRLGVVKINLPSLYERKMDILPLLFYFADKENIKGYSESALELLQKYDWPGNVRQLRNFVSRMAALRPNSIISHEEVESFIAEQGISYRHLPVVTGHTTEEAGHELIYHALLSLGNEVKMLRNLILENLPRQHDYEPDNEKEPVHEIRPDSSLREMEKELIASALKRSGNNRKEAARTLGIGERTLYRKLKEYNIS